MCNMVSSVERNDRCVCNRRGMGAYPKISIRVQHSARWCAKIPRRGQRFNSVEGVKSKHGESCARHEKQRLRGVWRYPRGESHNMSIVLHCTVLRCTSKLEPVVVGRLHGVDSDEVLQASRIKVRLHQTSEHQNNTNKLKIHTSPVNQQMPTHQKH